MARNSAFKLLAVASVLVVAGCSSNPPTGASGYSPKGGPVMPTPEQQEIRRAETERRAAAEIKALRQKQIDRAYGEGVKDTLEEFRGRMQAREGFVYQPPVIEWVDMPGQVINGAMVPAHRQMVILSAGRWIESNGAAVPAQLVEEHAVETVQAIDEETIAPAAGESRIEYVHE